MILNRNKHYFIIITTIIVALTLLSTATRQGRAQGNINNVIGDEPDDEVVPPHVQALYKEAKNAFDNKQYDEARRMLDRVKQLYSKSLRGVRIAEAKIDIKTSKPKTGKDILVSELPYAQGERDSILKRYDLARADPRKKSSENDLKRKLDNADRRVVEIEEGIAEAKTLMCWVFVHILEPARRDANLVVYLDSQILPEKSWDGSPMEVDCGKHVIRGVTPSTNVSGPPYTKNEVDVRFDVLVESTPQKRRDEVGVKVDHLRELPDFHPLSGYEKILDELDKTITLYNNNADQADRPKEQRACYNKAHADLMELSNKVKSSFSRSALKPSDSGDPDAFEIRIIRHVIQYEIKPCLEDCLNGQSTCDEKRDLPRRIWPGTGGCAACAIGSNSAAELESMDKVWFSVSIAAISLIIARTRRGSRRRMNIRGTWERV